MKRHSETKKIKILITDNTNFSVELTYNSEDTNTLKLNEHREAIEMA